ncbi:MAG: BREX system ATP-binding domain-containing protein [Thermomicrobiales bacterium]
MSTGAVLPSATPPDPATLRSALEQVAQYGVLGHTAADLLDVGTGPFLAYVEREIFADLVARGGATCRFFEGSYGSGKTHLLRLIGDRATARGLAVVQIELSRDLGLEDWSQITRYILERIEVYRDGTLVRSLPDILSALGRGGLSGVAALRRAHLPHAGFRAAMLRAVGEPTLPAPLRDYLRGERIGAAQLKRAGILGIRDPLSRRNAEQVLNTALGGLHHLGLPGTLLLFDENERTLISDRTGRAAFPKRLQTAANVMRRFIDGCTTGGIAGTIAVFAVLPGFLENATRLYPALGQRLEMTRDADIPPAWRWPVLPVDAVGTTPLPEDFLAQIATRLTDLVAATGQSITDLYPALHAAGTAVLAEQAGSGYRRPLMRRLAALTLERLDDSVVSSQ